MADKRNKIDSVDLEGKNKTVYVVEPSPRDSRDAQMAYNRIFRDALESGAILRQKLDSVMQEQGIWNETKQEEYEKVVTGLNDKEKQLSKGGIKLSEAEKIAKDMRGLRTEFQLLIAERQSMDSMTAEGQADNHRFNFLAARCIRNEENKPLFETVDEYEENGDQPYVVAAARQFAETMYGLDKNFDRNLPENDFLLEFGFVNDKLQYINKEGQLVNENGKLIDEEGRLVDKDGNTIDRDSNELDEHGRYSKKNRKPFLDDGGKPIAVESDEEEKEEEKAEKPPARKSRAKRTTANKTE